MNSSRLMAVGRDKKKSTTQRRGGLNLKKAAKYVFSYFSHLYLIIFHRGVHFGLLFNNGHKDAGRIHYACDSATICRKVRVRY